MRYFKILFGLLLITQINTNAQQIDSPTLLGDNFSLEATLNSFRQSSTLEEFEQKLNEESQNINNLDLNNDGETDYISVESIVNESNHSVVLYTFVAENERQDIAVIEIEKTEEENAMLQIIGDDSLYDENTIIEPVNVNEGIKDGNGPSILYYTSKYIINVWTWPLVRFMYRPNYVVWVSAYHWHHYPKWWRPWKPIKHSIFYTRSTPYRVLYHKTSTHRVMKAHKLYIPHRKFSTLVIKNGHRTTVVHKKKKGRVKTVRVKHKKR